MHTRAEFIWSHAPEGIMTSRWSRIWQVTGASLVLGLLASPAVFAAVSAQDQPNPQGAPEAVPVVPGSLELSLGGGVIFAPRPYEGASAAIIPIPVVTVRYKRLFADGIRGGVRFLQSGQLTGSAYLQANFEGLDSTDSPSLEGITNRRMSADAGAEIVVSRPACRVPIQRAVGRPRPEQRPGSQPAGLDRRAARPRLVPARRHRAAMGERDPRRLLLRREQQ